MARELIADNEFYTIEVDTAINRSFSVFRGFWPDTEEFKKTYIDNLEKTLSKMKPGFTNFLDIREFRVPPQSIMEIFIKAQDMTRNKGVKKSASVTNQPIQTIAADRISRETNMQETLRSFNTVEEAITWLDE